MWLKDLAYIITIVIEIAVPVTLAIIIWKKFKISWAIFFLGMVLFLASLIRVPLNDYLGALLQKSFRGELFYIFYGLMAGLTAAIFEEGVRCIAFGTVIKSRNYYKGVMYGIGHGGGGESMVFVGLTTLANYIIFRFFPNILPANIVPQMAQLAWYLPLVGALERVLAITIQIALSILIMYAFISKRYYIIFITMVFHMFVDFTAFYINYKFGFWFAEAAVAVFAVISIIILIRLKPRRVSVPEI